MLNSSDSAFNIAKVSFQMAGVLTVVILTNIFVNRKIDSILQSEKIKHQALRKSVLTAARHPFNVLVLILGLYACTLFVHTELFTTHFVTQCLQTSFVIIFNWFFLRLTSAYEVEYIAHKKRKKHKVDTTLVGALTKLARLSFTIFAFITILSINNIPTSGLLTAGGVGGVSIGFAAQDLLANFFGSLMIYLDRPFKIGDWVRSPDRNIEGTIEHIGARVTIIRTFDKRPLYIPNSIFTKIILENPSRMSNRRIYETIGIRYQDISVARVIIADIRKMLATHDDIAPNQTQMVYLKKFGPSSVDIMVYIFTKTTNWAEYLGVQEDVLLKINDIIEKHGGSIAFPTSVVHLEETQPETDNT